MGRRSQEEEEGQSKRMDRELIQQVIFTWNKMEDTEKKLSAQPWISTKYANQFLVKNQNTRVIQNSIQCVRVFSSSPGEAEKSENGVEGELHKQFRDKTTEMIQMSEEWRVMLNCDEIFA